MTLSRYVPLFSALYRQSLASGALLLILIALSLAISATTALRFSQQQILYSIDQQAAQLLGADLVISSSRPLDPQWEAHAQDASLETTQTLLFSSMASANDEFVLVNVKAIENAFPLRGELIIDGQQGPHLATGQIWLSPILFDLLQVQIGDEVQIADAYFTISGRIDKDSNQQAGVSGFSPTVIIPLDEVERTQAIQLGSRQEYRLLMRGEPSQIEAFLNQHEATLRDHEPGGSQADLSNGNLRLLKANDSVSQLAEPMRQLHHYMQLANLLTLLLCGIAIALSAQRYMSHNQDHVAMLRCLGASRRQLLASFAALLGLVALIATTIGLILGSIFGYSLLKVVALLLPQIELRFAFSEFITGPLPLAVFTCTLLLIGFVMPAIWQLSSLSPTQVLRPQSSIQLSWRTLIVAALVSLIAFALSISSSYRLGLLVLVGILILAIICLVSHYTLLAGLRRYAVKTRKWLREPFKTSAQITALALGLSLFTVLFLFRADLLTKWQEQLPEDTPNHFVLGIPPYDKANFEALLDERQWPAEPLYSFIRGRLVAKNGEDFEERLIERNNTLRRELNLTQSDIFPDNNEFIAGRPEFTGPNQLSVEWRNAQELELELGDVLRFELPDGMVEAEVVSFREVQWESFSPNFFFVFSPGTMAQDSASYLGSFYVPSNEKGQLIDLIRRYPTTVFIDVDAVLQQVMGIIRMISQVISYLAFLVMGAGLLVLLASLNLMLDARRNEVALLRVIGLSQGQIQRNLTLEVGAIGAAAGFTAMLIAELLSALAAHFFNLQWQLHGTYWLIVPLGMTVLCALIGRYRLRQLWLQAPLRSLRQID